MTRTPNLLPFTSLILFAGAIPASAEDWPHWRGPNRDGTTTESSGLRGDSGWLSAEPQWQREVGEGSTSPIVVGEQVLVMGWTEERDTLFCLDLASGTPTWKQSYEAPRHARFAVGDQRRYGGPTATPEFDEETGFVFTLGCDGELRAWDVDRGGELVWRINLYDRYEVKQRPKTGGGLRDYGYTTAPLAIDGELLVEVGGDSGTVVAFDPRTGEERWRSGYRKPAGHTGGFVPLAVEGIPCVAILTLHDPVVLRIDAGSKGETIATHAWTSDWANNILTPAVRGNEILISSYHTHRSIRKIRVGIGSADKVWEQYFASHVGSPVIQGDRIYFAGRRLYCLDWDTGELVWEGGIFGDGASLIHSGDRRILAFGGDCSLDLVDSWELSPEKHREVAKLRNATSGQPGDAWPHPCLANGWVLCKNRMGHLTARRANPHAH